MRLDTVLYRKVGQWTKAYANLPEAYIKRVMNEGTRQRIPGKPQFNYPLQRPRKPWYGLRHPWEAPLHARFQKGFVPVKPVLDWSYFPGDIVQVLEGKDKGKIGEVKAVYEERNWVLVHGLNIKLVFVKGDETRSDMYVEEEQPYLIDVEVALIDPKTKQATPVEWRYTEEGQKVRVSLSTETIIPLPDRAMTTIDYIKPEHYLERNKDTKLADVKQVTFKPALKTFEMDLMEKMNIKEERTSQKYYWY